MQYILTEEEYKALVDEPNKVRTSLDKTIQDLCQMVADHKPLLISDLDKWDKKWWKDGEPWGCIRSRPNEEWYCDLCPVRKMCTYKYKNYSK